MIQPLISTKLGIPATRPVLVPRQRLITRLNAGINGKLTLISAPAGYGKTTLAAEWLREAPRAVTWLSLDETDNDPARFLRYFLAALREIDEQAGEETGALLQSPQPPSPELLMTTLLNELNALSEPFILTLDDYHVIQTLSIHKLMNFIVEYQPARMHLVLLTREDPPLPLPRLRARGQVTELRQGDMRFAAQESAEFLEDVMGLKLSASDISALERRTEGWIAGLQMAALSISSQDNPSRFVGQFTGSSRFVLDYLVQEVFERQPEENQTFLLQTAILDRLCGSLCDAVTERPGSQKLLESLEQANLFLMPLDQNRTWYRYHNLFRDLLQNRLHAQEESVLSGLHLRASSWYEKQGLLSDAIAHTLVGADWKNALRMIHSTSDIMLKRGEIFTLLNWYNKIPESFVMSDAESCLDYGWTLALAGQFERVATFLAQAEEQAKDSPSFLGQVLNARAYLARAQGDGRQMVALSQQALSLLPKEDADSRCMVSTNLGIAYWHAGKMEAADRAMEEVLETGKVTGNLYAVSSALVFLGMGMAVRGKLREANARFQSIIQKSEYPAFIRGLAYLYTGVLQYEWNDLEQSGKNLQEAIKIGECIQSGELLVVSWMMMSRIQMATGKLDAAGELLDRAYQKAVSGDVPSTIMPRLAAAWVQLEIIRGNVEKASEWAGRLAEGCDWHVFYRFTNTTQALLLLAQGQNKEAAEHLQKCVEQASQEGWEYGLVAIRVLQSLAASQPEAALDYLTDGLKRAQAEGYIRTFADLGKGLEPLLHMAIQRRVKLRYAEKILTAVKERKQKPIVGQLSLVEPLNPRELEVLGLLAAGYTNQQIAKELFISIGTAKTHVHNICGKLGSGNRTEAAARAHELGLV